jgi:hypothetical protein
VVDYRDAAGIRRWVTCESRREADTVLAEKLRGSQQHERPTVDPDITAALYSKYWLTLVGATAKHSTVARYDRGLQLHILPSFGTTKVRELHRGRLKAFLADKLTSGLSVTSHGHDPGLLTGMTQVPEAA